MHKNKWAQTALWAMRQLSSAFPGELTPSAQEEAKGPQMGATELSPEQCSSLDWTNAHRKEPKNTLFLQHQIGFFQPRMYPWTSRNTWDTPSGGRSNSFQCTTQAKWRISSDNTALALGPQIIFSQGTITLLISLNEKRSDQARILLSLRKFPNIHNEKQMCSLLKKHLPQSCFCTWEYFKLGREKWWTLSSSGCSRAVLPKLSEIISFIHSFIHSTNIYWTSQEAKKGRDLWWGLVLMVSAASQSLAPKVACVPCWDKLGVRQWRGKEGFFPSKGELTLPYPVTLEKKPSAFERTTTYFIPGQTLAAFSFHCS